MRISLNGLYRVPSLLLASTTLALIAAPAIAQTIEIAGVTIQPTTQGLEVILQTDSTAIPQTFTGSFGTTWFVDIVNSQLRLPTGQSFEQREPAPGIASVNAVQQSPNSVRITIVGTTELPTVAVSDRNGQVILAATTDSPTATQPSPQPPPAIEPGQEEIEVLITTPQSGERYLVPNATTGTRTDTPIIDTPQAIQVVPQRVIQDQQVVRLEEALRNVSGVSFGGTSGSRGYDFSLRGFENAPIVQNGFRLYGEQPLAEVGTLERIEVLKGPASILYGDIQPGGIINLVGKRPLREPFYEAELQIGNRNFVRPRLDFSGPLTEEGNVLYRINAIYSQGESFRDYDQKIRRFAIAPIITWNISDRTDFSVSLDYLNEKRPVDPGLFAIGNRPVNVPRDRIPNEPDDITQNDYLSTGYDFEHRFSDNWKIRNAFRYQYYQYDYNFTSAPFLIDEETGDVSRIFAQQSSEDRSFTLQTNAVGEFNTGPVGHTLLFGVDLNRYEEDYLAFLDFSNPTTINIFNPIYGQNRRPNRDDLEPLGSSYSRRVNRIGVYLQDQLSFFDERLIFLAGLRYDNIDRETRPLAGDRDNQSDDAFTPRLGLVYKPVENVSLYASYSRSFTPNLGTTATGSSLEPEKGEGYEVGVKTELFDRRLIATLAYFDITKQNVAVADPDFPNLGFVIPTGRQRSRGVELDVTGEIVPGWNVIGFYTYNDAKVTRDTNPDFEGSRLANIPKHSAGLWTTYEIQQGDLQGLGFGVGFNFVGDRQGGLPNSFKLDSYFLTNAAIYYRRNNWQLALNFKNIFDVNYIESASTLRNANINPGEPFTVLGSITVQF
ncbi:TonB-dependent siderophore receptor [Geitlerinema calcuttense NRMC-F 0142]|uniref:TonB-dependent siderophore receptor n=1 Tax=Geitlerinema calcuttense NRMC-F 0142 TaxID=2922238 RepID=A0ABT7LZ46_9CYAN|nr:TonB-dependent siderophore receptor [Geitlerinema calcuttense NRMC-F 0142]